MLYFKRTLPVTLISLSLFSANSYAEQSYQTELIAGYEKTDADTSTDKTTLLSAEIFFSPVNTENKPLAAAAFLDKSSSIGIAYFKSKTDLQNSSVNSVDFSGPAVLVNYITETDAFILGAVYSQTDIDTGNNLVTGDQKIAGISLGKYLNDSSALEFTYTSSDEDIRNTSSDQTFSASRDQYTLSYKIVQSLNAENFYGLDASIELIKNESSSVKEDNHELEILGEYYFSRMTNIAVEASFNSGDDLSQEGRTFEISAAHFFTPQIAFNFGLSRFYADDNQTEDTDSVFIEALARF